MSATSTSKRTVFLVHGRDDAARKAMEAFLKSLYLKVVRWHQAATWAGGGSPYTGDIVRAGLDRAGAVVVLLTPDDIGHLRPEFLQDTDGNHERQPTGQPRMNVVFEAGMAMAMRRESVVLVEVGPVRRMSDIDGVNVIRLDDSYRQRKALAERLKAAGLDVDTEDDEEWQTAGSFTRPPLLDAPVVPALPPAASKAHDARPSKSGKPDAYLAFWRKFRDTIRGVPRASWVQGKSPRTDNWLLLRSRSPWGGYIVSFASRGRLRSEFYVDGGDGDRNLVLFRSLFERRRDIESAFGGRLDWEELPGRRACRIAVYRPGDVLDLREHDDYVAWFIDSATRLHDAIDPYLG